MVMEGEPEPATKHGQLDTVIPDIVQAWDTPVRRPTTLPEPGTYHEAVDPAFIFELCDEGNKKSKFVVPRRCQYCTSIAQACSRALPKCGRCAKSGRTCTRVGDGYDVLPGPKISKRTKNKCPESEAEGSAWHVVVGADAAEDGYVLLVYFITPAYHLFGLQGRYLSTMGSSSRDGQGSLSPQNDVRAHKGLYSRRSGRKRL